MKDEILFYEIQPFWRNWVLKITLLLVNLLFISGFIRQVIFGSVWGNQPMSDAGLSIVTGVMLLFSVFLLISKQQTVITEEGIYLRYTPLDFRTRFFAWENIGEAYLRKYSPIREFGGWGLRFKYYPGRERVYNVSGNMGLQLIFNNGRRKVLIGTNQAEELTEVLRKLDDKREQK